MISLRNSATTETVMVVESEVLVRSTIADYLRSCGYRVLEGANAEEAVTVLACPEIRIDVVLSAVQMRGPTNGFTLRRWVMEKRPDVDVILAGTPARAVDTATGLCEAGPKPSDAYEPHAVLDRVKRKLAARQPSLKSA